MITQHLTSDLILDTALWRLVVQVGATKLTALLLGPSGAERTVMAHVEPLADGSLKALENAIYDNPLLLGDFLSVQLLIDSSEFMLCPDGLESVQEQMALAMLPDSERPSRMIESSMPGGKMLTLVSADKFNFLMRTFPDASVRDALSPSACWLAYFNRQRGDRPHMYAICEPGRTQILKFGENGQLRFANTFTADSAADRAYFILAACGDERLPVSVGGFPDLRNAVTDILRVADPALEVLPLTLPQNLLEMRRLAPEIPDSMLFLTQL